MRSSDPSLLIEFQVVMETKDSKYTVSFHFNELRLVIEPRMSIHSL